MKNKNLLILKQSNHILSGIEDKDWYRWEKSLSSINLELNSVVHKAGREEKFIYLPVSCIISVKYDFEDGNSAEFAEVGNEGMTGTFIISGNSTTVSQSSVMSKGLAYRVDSSFVNSEFKYSSSFRTQILSYLQYLMLYTAQTAVCNRRHSITQQLARFLLINIDRSLSKNLFFTHELIAQSLGVRREGVTQAALELQIRGDIEYTRGTIALKNRNGLLKSSCECYRIVKNETDRLTCSKKYFYSEL